jgi:hypothetical protein
MLYDPKWEKTTKADPFTLASFTAWLEAHPKRIAYDYMNCSGACLYAQYMASVGVPWSEAGASSALRRGDVHQSFREQVIYPVASPRPWTFGAALDRARAALAAG